MVMTWQLMWLNLSVATLNATLQLLVIYRLDEHLRNETWDLLKHLSTWTSTPWLCIGDYNEILSAEEKNGRLPKPMHLM